MNFCYSLTDEVKKYIATRLRFFGKCDSSLGLLPPLVLTGCLQDISERLFHLKVMVLLCEGL